MLLRDQDSWPAPHSAYGLSGPAGAPGGRIQEIAREIEETQRRQGETIAHIVGRLRTLDLRRNDTAGDDQVWDPSDAEALMRSCEADAAAQGPYFASARAAASSHQDWIGHRFNDVTERLKRTLSDLKPGNTMVMLEERLDQFQRHIGSALEDVVRRSDIDGLRLIEQHVNELGGKLIDLERHVSRLDGIEADVRSVIDQVSDERIAKLLDSNSRYSTDLEAVALRAAEEVHARLGQDDGRAEADARRHEELRALIEASIQERRQAAAEAASLVSGLSGRVSAQDGRYDEIKALLEHATQEQRQNDQTALGMLDTLQQALVQILDRMDVLEQQHKVAAPAPSAQAPFAEAYAHAAIEDLKAAGFAAVAMPDRVAHDDVPAASFGRLGAAADVSISPVEIPAAFDSGALDPNANDVSGSPVDRLRRDFIADARRAKLKAAANRAEAITQKKSEPPKRAGLDQTRAALSQAARLPLAAAGSSRLLGTSPKLLAAVLAVVVAINGGILLFNRKSDIPPPAPVISFPDPAQSGAAPGGAPAEATPEHGANSEGAPPGTGQRSELDDDGSGLAEFVPHAVEPPPEARSQQSTDDAGHAFAPYDSSDDILNPAHVEANDGDKPVGVPSGMTIARPAGTMPKEAAAGVYEQQVLASLSGKLGTIAAGKSPDALLPDENGRIDSAYSPATIAPDADGASRTGMLDMPPASVGPTSLRLAAANGDASAEFEVAARLAEGKGTEQNYAEALRWYQRSAAKGFAQAQYRIGTFYERGLGVGKDLERSRVWYTRAAEQGNVKSMHNLAVLAAAGDDGNPNYAGAMQWFVKAAEHGLADSQYNLAVLLENGLGVKADPVAAYKWYALAAKNGDPDSQERLDALGAKLSASERKTADETVAAFRARAAIPLANDARAAGEDWKKRANNN